MVEMMICSSFLLPNVLVVRSPGWAYLAQQSCKIGVSKTMDYFVHESESTYDSTFL